jgi:serine/threonine-protein kinase
LREASAHGEDVERAERELAQLERAAHAARAEAQAALQSNRAEPSVFERAGATAAHAQAKRDEMGRYKQRKENCEKTARGLRRQIEQLRGQLSRYAEALEEDLTRGRNQVGERTREGLRFEKAFHEVSGKLLGELKGKPECRDLINDLMEEHKRYDDGGEPSSRRAPERSDDSGRGSPPP